MIITNPRIIDGTARLKQALLQVNPDDLPLHDYNRYYLKKHLAYLDYNLYINGLILQQVMQHRPDAGVLVDYGCGTGLLGFLAWFCTDAHVVFADNYPQACEDLPHIAAALGIHNRYEVLCGDSETIIGQMKTAPDAVMSRDVVEHIYKLGSFFSRMSQAFPNAIQVHNTAANAYNVLRKKEFRHIHDTAEFKGDPGNQKDSDSKEAFYSLRKAMITEKYAYLKPSVIEHIARMTRGMAQKEIIHAVDAYLQSEITPIQDKYPHNTCDPRNGNWAERLLYFGEYRIKAAPAYTCHFSGVLYNTAHANLLKQKTTALLNFVIRSSGKSGRYIWPSFTLLLLPVHETKKHRA